MGFRDDVFNDIASVFLNDSEFAEEHKIGNKTTVCVIDEEKFQSKQKNSQNFLSDDGLFREGFTLFVEKSFFRYVPHTGELLKVDDVEYEVVACKIDMGLVEIDLLRYDERW